MDPSFDPFWGEPSLRPRVYRNSGKGNWFAARPRYVKEAYGEGAFVAVAEALSEEARRYFLKPPMAFSWLPIKLLYDMDYAIVQGPMQGRLEDMELFGSSIAVYDLNWLYQTFLKLSSPEFLLRQAGLICRTYIKEAKLSAEVWAGKAHFSMSSDPLARYMCNYGIPGWIGAALRATGARDVFTEHSVCLHLGGKTCEWNLRWQI